MDRAVATPPPRDPPPCRRVRGPLSSRQPALSVRIPYSATGRRKRLQVSRPAAETAADEGGSERGLSQRDNEGGSSSLRVSVRSRETERGVRNGNPRRRRQGRESEQLLHGLQACASVRIREEGTREEYEELLPPRSVMLLPASRSYYFHVYLSVGLSRHGGLQVWLCR